MKWQLILILFYIKVVAAEESILLEKKSIIKDLNAYRYSEETKELSNDPIKMKLSDRYKEQFEALLKINSPIVNNKLEACNKLIDASLDLESGTITKEQFSSIRRKAMILWNTPIIEDHEPVNESREIYKEQPLQNKRLNCSSTTSGNTVYTNCY